MVMKWAQKSNSDLEAILYVKNTEYSTTKILLQSNSRKYHLVHFVLLLYFDTAPRVRRIKVTLAAKRHKMELQLVCRWIKRTGKNICNLERGEVQRKLLKQNCPSRNVTLLRSLSFCQKNTCKA